MGLNISYEENKDGLGIFLTGIQVESEKIEKEMLKKSGDRARELVVAELNKHRRPLSIRYKGRPAMADDVKRTIRSNRWGERYVSIRGGKATGTLWHIVNDGTLHSSPTHFLDEAMKKIDEDIDELWDEVMK